MASLSARARVTLCDGRWVKLNRFRNRLNANDLRECCYRLQPRHVYFSVLNWLFPERVGREYKAQYSLPLNSEYVADIDSYLMLFKHKHKVENHWYVCEECLGMSKQLTLQLCAVIKKYYERILIVFSGCAGFHVHVLDFSYHDWVQYHWNNPIWAHHASRFKFTRLLQKQTHVFDRAHFTLSCDPMRIVAVPSTVNGKTGLVCRLIGTPKDLEVITIQEILELSKAFPNSHLETLGSSSVNDNGLMKKGAKNSDEAAMQR